MTTVRFVIVDVFTDRALAGNQLAVFTNATGLSGEQMQSLALEMGFSECTFVLPSSGDAEARIRIFTPERELPFAGHPVLGTAFVLGVPLQRTLLTLETGRGDVPVMLTREGAKIVFGTMAQPIPAVAAFERTAEVFAALGIDGAELPVEVYDNGIEHVMVALRSAEQVAALEPDFAALRHMGEYAVSCFAADASGVTTRVFVPDVGVPEDAATGSAAGPLALHLARHGVTAFGDDVVISQGASIGRPSTLHARVEGSAEAVTAVEVGGSAVVVARGEFTL